MLRDMAGRGRPRSADPKDTIIQVKLTASERGDLDRLVEAWRADAADLGAGQVSASSVLRALMRRDLKARGLPVSESTATPKPAKKGGKR